MSLTVTITLDDETGAYLERIAADQVRTPAEVVAWIVTEDLRREQTIDAELSARLDNMVAITQEESDQPAASLSKTGRHEHARA